MKTVPSTYQVLYTRKPTLQRKPLLVPLNPDNDVMVNAVNDRSPEEVHPNRFTLQSSSVGTSLPTRTVILGGDPHHSPPLMPCVINYSV